MYYIYKYIMYIYNPVRTSQDFPLFFTLMPSLDLACGAHFPFNNHDLFEKVDWN